MPALYGKAKPIRRSMTDSNSPSSTPSAGSEERIEALAARLGFTDVSVVSRDAGTSPLIHARWRGAPVALSLRTGIAGGFSCAFYRGPSPEENTKSVDEEAWGEWDEVGDTQFGDPEMALVLGAAILSEYGGERTTKYQDVPMPPHAHSRREKTDDEVLSEVLKVARQV